MYRNYESVKYSLKSNIFSCVLTEELMVDVLSSN